jgi:acetoacetate decarboxylase
VRGKLEKDTLMGTLFYGSEHIATATMGYKHQGEVAGLTLVATLCGARTVVGEKTYETEK